jgi:hypothetical protein
MLKRKEKDGEEGRERNSNREMGMSLKRWKD